MTRLIVQPAAKRYFKEIKDKKLQQLFTDTIAAILDDPSLGEMKKGDLSGVQCVDVFYNKTNYEVAYRVAIVESAEDLENTVVVVILAGTRENFYAELKRYI